MARTDDAIEQAWAVYRRDGGAAAFGALAALLTPLLHAACRTRLRDGNDADAVVNLTLTRLTTHADAVRGSPLAWSRRVAVNACTDLHRRRAARRRAERRVCVDESGADGRHAQLRVALLSAALPRAMEDLPAEARELLRLRFLASAKLDALAEAYGVSVPTMSRRVRAALTLLRRAAAGHGIDRLAAEDLQLLLRGQGTPLPRGYFRDAGLRRWEPTAGGGTRRVGILISGRSLLTPVTAGGWSQPDAVQPDAADFLRGPGTELLSVVEPRTLHLPVIERVIRDHGIAGAGAILSTDREALGTLDALVVDQVWRVDPETLAAVLAAVGDGLGLLVMGYLGVESPGLGDPGVMRLMLARERPRVFHSRGCPFEEAPLQRLEPHPTTRTLRRLRTPTRTLTANACNLWGPLVPGARLVASSAVLPALEAPSWTSPHRPPEAPTSPLQSLVVGGLGRGRIARCQHRILGDTTDLSDAETEACFADLVAWIARGPEPVA